MNSKEIEFENQIAKLDERIDSVNKVIDKAELWEEDLIRQQRGMQGPSKIS